MINSPIPPDEFWPAYGPGLDMEKIAESVSTYRHLEKMTVRELLTHINAEDQTVPQAVARSPRWRYWSR